MIIFMRMCKEHVDTIQIRTKCMVDRKVTIYETEHRDTKSGAGSWTVEELSNLGLCW